MNVADDPFPDAESGPEPMPAAPLKRHLVYKPWGRRDVPAVFGPVAEEGEPLGEVWFQGDGGANETLLVKYLFTSEKLSIQVHPDDEAAQAAGHPRGKDEAWLILDAAADAVIGAGLKRAIGKDELRAAALSGDIEALVDWRPARAGDILYSPAGTIHALGPGLTLIEVQQNVDVTYRLYDYGRPRELHLDLAVAAADPKPFDWAPSPRMLTPGRKLLIEGPKFVLESWRGCAGKVGGGQAPAWVIPVSGDATLDADPILPGSVHLVDESAELKVANTAELLLAYAGHAVRFSSGS